MKMWRDVGRVEFNYRPAFQAAALEIEREEKSRAEVARLLLAEPLVGEWGDTKRDLPARVVPLICQQLEPQQAFQIMPGGLVPVATSGFPEIAEAMERKSVRFLVGTAPDNTRRVGIVIVASSNWAVLDAAKRPWWKLW